ncbi:uncharacterized protein [Primulina eburnea]|uniref:uncharacterized protein n=1 Tax=Primulina eburnea TaxID=1245227 RepID=UPI003C6CC391
MSSRFQAAVLVSAPCYPNSVAWSEENLVAVASGSLVTILNPAKPSGAGCRGVISVLPSKPFSIGVINAGDFLSGCLFPMHVSRDTRPCVRSISWSPAGLASNAGCLLAVCTTVGGIKLYRFPFCDFSAEWIEVMDISEMMYNYLSKINFGESQIISSESLDVIESRDNAESECPNEPPVSSCCKKLDNVKENNTWEIIPISVSEGTPLKIKECNVQLITAQQYASRINAMLTPLIVAWSPILRTSEDWVSIPHNSSGCCSILATGLKCGLISFWRIDAPEIYSIITPELPCKASNGGFLKVTGLAWAFDGLCLYSCCQVPYVYDSCFGLAVSHGSLAIAVARRFGSDLLNPMYQERTQKAAIEFLSIEGQQLDTSSNICFDIDFGSFPGFPEVELIWWEKNILWSLILCGSFSGLLNILDIVAALVSFKQSIPNYVEHILQKWLTSYYGSNFGIYLLSDVPTNFCDVECWRPDEWPQLEHYISLHEKIVEDDLKFLAAKVGKIKKRRESFEYEEHCSFCSAIVPFESIEYAICSGVKNGNGVDQTHKPHRCSPSRNLSNHVVPYVGYFYKDYSLNIYSPHLQYNEIPL